MHETKEKTRGFGSTGGPSMSGGGRSGKQQHDKSQEGASGIVGAVTETIQNAATGIAERAGDTVAQVRSAADEWMGSAEEAAKTAARAAGETCSNVASNAAQKVADAGGELGEFIRRYPAACLVGAIGVGFLIGTVCHRD